MPYPYRCYECKNYIYHNECKCGECKTVPYCSIDCQKKDYPKHKSFCKTIKQLRADDDDIRSHEIPPLTLPPSAISISNIRDENSSCDDDDIPELEDISSG
jgi:hypothetical protein